MMMVDMCKTNHNCGAKIMAIPFTSKNIYFARRNFSEGGIHRS
jgi:hypothetical protein